MIFGVFLTLQTHSVDPYDIESISINIRVTKTNYKKIEALFRSITASTEFIL